MYQACKNGDLTYIAENGNNIGVNEVTFIGQRGHLELVKYLYFQGHDMSELLEQACKYEHCDVVDWLMTTDIRLPPNILRFPCHNGNTNIFKALVGKGANVNFTKHPLFNAVRSGHVHIIHELYLCGANLMVFDHHQGNALHLACRADDYDMVRCLLDYRVPIIPTERGYLPQHYTIDAEILKLFSPT